MFVCFPKLCNRCPLFGKQTDILSDIQKYPLIDTFIHYLFQIDLQGNRILLEKSDSCLVRSDIRVSYCILACSTSCSNPARSVNICQQDSHQNYTLKPKQ